MIFILIKYNLTPNVNNKSNYVKLTLLIYKILIFLIYIEDLYSYIFNFLK